MQVDFLIIGQGISGTWLSYYLQKENKSFLVIDNNNRLAPSRIAAGIINPVTGRRHVEVWMAGEILPFARNAYSKLGDELQITAISQKDIIDFFPTAQMRLSFQQRVEEKGGYVTLDESMGDLRQWFNYDFGYGQISPVFTAHLESILPAWRKKLHQENRLLEETFKSDELNITKETIRYKGITALNIIFCDGNSSAASSFFNRLPFAPNKGEALIVEIPGLPADQIYKKGMLLTPLQGMADSWWVGSNYAWVFDNGDPTTEFRIKTEALLKHWLKVPFTTREHLCGIRPATIERRPFVGLHPQYPLVGILNGMGTKGCSLAPFFARQLSDHLLYNKAISPEADIARFKKVLTKQIDNLE